MSRNCTALKKHLKNCATFEIRTHDVHTQPGPSEPSKPGNRGNLNVLGYIRNIFWENSVKFLKKMDSAN